VISIFLLGCSTLEKNLLFQKNVENKDQKKQKIEKQGLPVDERKILKDIEKNLENITVNIAKLSYENTKTFEKISAKVNKLEATVARLQTTLVNKEETNKKVVNQSNPIIQLGREDYQAAFELLKEGDYETARNSFITFIELYQDSEFIDDAKYWLAETYYAQRAYVKALKEFKSIQILFPDSGKIPETILKSGFCYFELGDFEQAKQILILVTNQYPDTSVARLAVQKLKTINSTVQ
jgi:tol-pal system protein YbgF